MSRTSDIDRQDRQISDSVTALFLELYRRHQHRQMEASHSFVQLGAAIWEGEEVPADEAEEILKFTGHTVEDLDRFVESLGRPSERMDDCWC